MHYLDALNARQREAVQHIDGPLLIVAGAGAGKTRVITHRIFHLIQNGVSPESILAITFTNKAAKEMKDRVFHLLHQQPTTNNLQQDIDPGASVVSGRLSVVGSPWIGTFHALGVHIIRENSRRLGIPRHFAIFDRSDSLRSVKEALKRAGYDPKSFEPASILSAVSREKGDMVTLPEFRERAAGEYFPAVVAEVWTEYEKILKSEKAFDFDDLLLEAALLLQKDAGVREHYQRRFRFIHIDEYQDTNRVQYILAKLLAEAHQNIAVVGDLDQCLVAGTLIETPTGTKSIETLKEGEKVLAAAGNGALCQASILSVKKRRYKGNILEIKTEGGNVIRTTPEHIFFAKLTLQAEMHYIYLMYKREKGYRIGIVRSVRSSSRRKNEIGLLVRCNQEHADRVWVLKVCADKAEAAFWESYYSTQYGLPQDVFHVNGRKMILRQEHIDRLYHDIDTTARAAKLLQDEGLHFAYPHYFPQGTTRGNTERGRINIRLTMFSDKRRSARKPWGLSRVSINTTDSTLKEKLAGLGFSIRKGKREDWRLEITRLDYGEAEQIAATIQTLDPSLTIVRTGLFTANKRFLFQPARNLLPTMLVPVYREGHIREESIVSVQECEYAGDVYDLNISELHNYIAQHIVVHNCIYSWRGASIRNMLHFEKDYSSVKVVLLEENYRSTQTILAVANRIIGKNKLRREKTLFTKNAEGEKIGLYTAYDEMDEAAFAAGTAQQLIETGVPPREIAVLFRANFQSRALEEAFMNAEVPYQVLGVRFFERKEVKDIISYVRAALNPDPPAGGLGDVKRIINVPPRGLGKVTLLKIFAGKEGELPSAARERIGAFRKLLAVLRKKLSAEPLSVALKWIVTASGVEAELKKGGADDEERLENIKELVTFAMRYDVLSDRTEAVNQFLTDAALQSDQDELQEERNAVRLMTVHASKGLEFDCVFITGLEQDLFPHSRAGEEDLTEEKAEEERRLFYVALTRARKKVFLSYAGVRTIFGSRQVTVPSEFIFDIDEEFLQAENPIETAGKTLYFE